MTEREYVEALVRAMRDQWSEAEERGRTLANPAAARKFMEEERQRSLNLLDSLDPPDELRDLHARLRLMAQGSIGGGDEDDLSYMEDIMHLARLADGYGLQLVPGMTLAEVEAAARNGSFEWTASDGDWESRLRRSLADDGRQDIDGIVERMRMLREK